METNYLNTDLVVDSHHDLQALVAEFGDNVIVLYHGPFNDMNRAVFELTFDSAVAPEEVVNGFCELVENLSPRARTVWEDSYKRVMDIGVESGASPRPYILELSSSALRRVSVLEGSLMISVYPMMESQELP